MHSDFAALPGCGACARSGTSLRGTVMMPGTIFWMRVPPLALVLSVLAFAPASAQSARAETSAVYLYKGADRDQRLVEAARKEGTLTFYTSMQTPESGPLSQAFAQKYGIKVQLWR